MSLYEIWPKWGYENFEKSIWHNWFFSSGRTYQVLENYENKEISTNYVMNGNYVMNEIRFNRKEVNVDNIFAHNIALYVIRNNEDYELKSIENYR